MNRTAAILIATLAALGLGSTMTAAEKPPKAAGDKLTQPVKTIRHARKNLPGCIETEDGTRTAGMNHSG